MTRFTLVVLPDGKAILTTKDRLDERAMHEIIELMKGWNRGADTLAIIHECEVVQVSEIDLDFEKRTVTVPMPPPSHANAIGGPQTVPPRGVSG